MSRTARPIRWLFAVGGLALLTGAWVWLAPHTSPEPRLSREQFEQETGLRLVRVALTGGGGLIDIRYQVVDPDKAVAIHDPVTPPAIIDETSGLTLDRPWMDHAHRRELHMAVTYYTLLLNPGRMVKRGDKVTFKVGAARLFDLAVE